MVTISLDWIPNTALCEFIEHQWYYLPESLAKGKSQEWTETMQALLMEANNENRNIEVRLDAIIVDDPPQE